METVEELKKLIKLEKVSENEFVGQNYVTPWNRVFGGQVLAQTLSAAAQTVPDQRIAHSMHGYFLIGGDVHVPINFEVDIVRDGGSFSTRRVKAVQNGNIIFIVAISFQKKQTGFEHQIPMPNVPGPEGLASDEDLAKRYKMLMPTQFFDTIKNRPFEFRMVEQPKLFSFKASPPYRHIWFKTKQLVNEEYPIHQQLLAYVSDYNLLTTATLPHVKGALPNNLFLASLDHGMWFHREFKIDEWLLYALDSPSASNSRGFSRGNIFTQDGRLVASTVQEGLIRKLKK